VVVMDEAVADEFRPGGDLLERLMYGYSLLVCLPDGLSHPGSAGTGTVMREATLRSYADDAGFAELSVLPIEDFGFWRFYELRCADHAEGLEPDQGVAQGGSPRAPERGTASVSPAHVPGPDSTVP
jgi:hypothetical protein